MRQPLSSAIAFTIKLGALPTYVIAPMNTVPTEIAARKLAGLCPTAGATAVLVRSAGEPKCSSPCAADVKLR
jgi:hypothetical protein